MTDGNFAFFITEELGLTSRCGYQGPICRGGVGGFNPPNDFFDPPSLRRF